MLMFDPQEERDRYALEKLVLKELLGGLWHTTHPDRFKKILVTGAILPEPDLPDSERWKTAAGESCYPYVRKLGGVSLFEFHLQFDPERYGQEYPLSTWFEFVPYDRRWDSAVWIEIDRAKVGAQLISGLGLVTKWNEDKAYRHTFMPEIEAAHLLLHIQAGFPCA